MFVAGVSSEIVDLFEIVEEHALQVSGDPDFLDFSDFRLDMESIDEKGEYDTP
jgi:hypothetical protein